MITVNGPAVWVITPWRGKAAECRRRTPWSWSTRGWSPMMRPGWSMISACVGAPWCDHSRADTRALAAQLAARPQAAPRIHLSGCERRCGAPAGDHLDLVAPTPTEVDEAFAGALGHAWTCRPLRAMSTSVTRRKSTAGRSRRSAPRPTSPDCRWMPSGRRPDDPREPMISTFPGRCCSMINSPPGPRSGTARRSSPMRRCWPLLRHPITASGPQRRLLPAHRPAGDGAGLGWHTTRSAAAVSLWASVLKVQWWPSATRRRHSSTCSS